MSERDDGNGAQDNAWAQLARRLATNDKIIAVLKRENADLRKENSALLAGNEEWEREHDDVKLARDVAIQQAETLGAHVSMIEAHAKRCGMDDPKTSILAMILDRGPETSLARRDAMVAADTCQALHDEFDCYKNERDRLKVKTVRFVLSRWKGAFQRKAREES